MRTWYKVAQEDPFDIVDDEGLESVVEETAQSIEAVAREASMSQWEPVPPEVMKGARAEIREVPVQARVVDGIGQFRHMTADGKWWESQTFTNDYKGWKNKLDKFLQIPTGRPFAMFYGWLKQRFGVTIPIHDTLLPRYECQHKTIGGWENVWSEGDEPITFETREEAQRALDEYIAEINEVIRRGNSDLACDPVNFRVTEVRRRNTN